ncbi:MAG TPA: YgiQ family radical SAM protein [Candidatus Cloacimonadota bacterium]|nr:YgiQ family radical SAM protein [Candidatus Cloacimonadota bacterium]
MSFIPLDPNELTALGITQPDFILISGDAYVDHPSFGAAIIGKSLIDAGFSVAIIAQPDWKSDTDFLKFGRPRLGFGITSGNMDSMVNHYTAQRKIRSDDAYSPGGIAGKRPDRAVLVYTNIIKRLFKGVPVIIGGIEGSLRRISHYDYWSDTVKNSLLADTKADILVYGMAEKTLVTILQRLKDGEEIKSLKDIRGTVVFDDPSQEEETAILPASDATKEKRTYHEMYRQFYHEFQSRTLYQLNGGRYIRHNPPAEPLTGAELDHVYSLKFENAPHPSYGTQSIPAWEQIRDSITTHRGCYGGCNFCAIHAHQGREIQSRSQSSILKEVKGLTAKRTTHPSGQTYRFHGTISDLGGPTANMYGSYCRQNYPDSCRRRSCIFPNICANLSFDHKLQLKLLEAVERVDGVKHVFISSGIRHDMALSDRNYIAKLATHYTGGRLKLAPEHVSDKVLRLMGKPPIALYEKFCVEFYEETDKAGIKRQVIPYLIIGHPGTEAEDARRMSEWLRKNRIRIEQVQEFTPTPMTISTCMYYTGLDFETGKPIHIPHGREIREQKDILFWWKR